MIKIPSWLFNLIASTAGFMVAVLFGVMIEAVREQRGMIEALESTRASYVARLDQLELRMNRIDARYDAMARELFGPQRP